jgi:hypothetical protein
VTSMTNILHAEYGVSLSSKKLIQGMLKFLSLINPTGSDSGDFRNDLKAATGVDVNTCAEMIFMELATSITSKRRATSQRSADARADAKAKAKANPSSHVASSAHQSGLREDRVLKDCLPIKRPIEQEAVEQEGVLKDCLPIKRPIKQEAVLEDCLPINRPTAVSRSTAKIADADDIDDEFALGMDWSTVGASVYANLGQGSAVLAEDREDSMTVAVAIAPKTARDLGQEAVVASSDNTPPIAADLGPGSDSGQEAVVASNKNTPLIAVESGRGSDSRHEAPVAPNKNTPGGAVAVAAVESAQACDSASILAAASILAGAIVPKLDAEVPDTGNAEVPDTGNAEVPDTGKPATGEIEKDEASIAVESGPGSDSRHEAPVAPNKNTPGGAVTVDVVESAQASDSASILACHCPEARC